MTDLEEAKFATAKAATLDRLERWCACNDVLLTPAGECEERAACYLLGYSSRDALRHQAAQGRLSPVLRRRRIGPKWVYTLDSIAELIVLGYERNAAP